jgi:transmembrane sensor
MVAKDERVRDLIAQQAADWFVANRAGLDSKERAAFAEWLVASPMHVEEYLALSAVARDLPRAAESSAASIEELIARARADAESGPRAATGLLGFFAALGRPPMLLAGAAVVLIGLGLALLAPSWLHRPAPQIARTEAPALIYSTRHGEQQAHLLADQSVVHLNTDSSIRIRYDAAQRLAVLTAGQAEFDVAHDPKRAFKVVAGAANVTAVGTRFDVRLDGDATVITVVEGRVRIEPARTAMAGGEAFAALILGASRQIRVRPGSWPPDIAEVDADKATSWLRRQITFDHEPLELVASEMSRYAPKPIEIATPALRDLKISGIFATDDSDAFIAFLRSLDGVTVEVTPTRIRVLRE